MQRLEMRGSTTPSQHLIEAVGNNSKGRIISVGRCSDWPLSHESGVL